MQKIMDLNTPAHRALATHEFIKRLNESQLKQTSRHLNVLQRFMQASSFSLLGNSTVKSQHAATKRNGVIIDHIFKEMDVLEAYIQSQENLVLRAQAERAGAPSKPMVH